MNSVVSAEIRNGVSMPREIATWKTIKLGTYRSARDLTNAVKASGFQIGDYAAQMLAKITVAKVEMDRRLVLVTLADLGFIKGTYRGAIYARARELGLDLVPAEVGPQLRLQYANQPVGEWMVMAMKPIADSEGNLRACNVVSGAEGQLLRTDYGYPVDGPNPDYRWVFARNNGKSPEGWSISTR